MSQHAELLFKADRVRAINDLDVGGHRDDEPSINLRPHEPGVSVGGGQSGTAGGLRVLDSDDEARVTVDGKSGAGVLRVTDRSKNIGMRLAGGGTAQEIQAYSGEDVTVGIENTTTGGRASLWGVTEPQDPVVLAEAISGSQTLGRTGGRVVVRNQDAENTGILDGRDGLLLLRGGAESPPDESTLSPEYGGGELVIGEFGQPNDLHIHATAERDSDYGVNAGNRPRILLRGPDATMEVGRKTPATAVPDGNGSVRIRDDTGHEVLEMRATGSGSSEVEFFLSDGSRSQTRAKIAPHPDGLMVSVNNPNTTAGSEYHTLLVTKQGDVVTRTQIQENVSL
jgi:hypothetical protein